MKRKKVVVAGATGYLGRHVVVALREAGHSVRALVRDESRLGDARGGVDELFVGEATKPETLKGLCADADVLFSSLGTRSLRGSPTVWDVDYAANMNVVREARAAKVAHVVFVAAVNGARTRTLAPQMEARERVVDELVWHGPAFTILRPTGFFNDMAELFQMAKSGTVWLCGDGQSKINPIGGEDLAREVVRAIENPTPNGAQVDVGGPETLSFEAAARLALASVGMNGQKGKKGAVRHLPTSMLHVLGRAVGHVNVNLGNLMQLMAVMGDMDFVGAPAGEHRLAEFYADLASKKRDLSELTWAR